MLFFIKVLLDRLFIVSFKKIRKTNIFGPLTANSH